ncbi:Fatty acid oxidation complex subunit alpha [Streptomyces antimycoticus]
MDRLPHTGVSTTSPSDLFPSRAPLTTVAVVGLGTMGTGIAEILARAGREVIGIDVSEGACRRAVTALEVATARAVHRERIAERERAGILGRFRVSTDLRAAADAELVIEVVPEDYDTKHEVFAELDTVISPTAIVATGTNALSVTRLAAESAHPERVLGLHFFNPAPAMKLVEIVSSVLTAPAAVEAVTALARDLGKEPVALGDRPGFVADGLLFGYLNQAAAMYEAKYAAREDIDAAMRLGCGLPMGPLALLDLIGIDTARTVLEAMYAASGDRLHAPAPILGQLSEAGLTGRKAGRGFYTYEAPGSAAVVPDAATAEVRHSTEGARPVRAVGVAGLGHDGLRDRRGLREGGPGGGAGRPDPGEGRAGEGPHREIPGKVGVQGADDQAGPGAGAGADHRGRRTRRVRRGRSRRGGGGRGPGRQAAALRTRQGLQTGCGAGHDHLLAGRGLRTGDLRPQDVVGLHFFNPAPAMKLVEVVRTVLTADDVRATAHAVCAAVGKHPVDCGDRAGFIVNALLFPYLNNAVKMVQEHYATPDAIDAAMKLGGGYPIGPLRTARCRGCSMCRWPSSGCCTGSSVNRAWRRRRCWSIWWPRGAWGARPGAAFASMRRSEFCSGWGGPSESGSGWGGLLEPSVGLPRTGTHKRVTFPTCPSP